jgi:adenylosuccinate synthase
MIDRAFAVIGLGYGDEGKGRVVDYLVREHKATTVVRFNGGGQAAHNVHLPDGRHHTFSQFGSGTFVPGVQTHLSEYVLLDPCTLMVEDRNLRHQGVTDALDRLSVDPRAVVVTPFHGALNRIRERARGDRRHGSCGMGIGECAKDAAAQSPWLLYAGRLGDRRTVREFLAEVQRQKALAAWSLDYFWDDVDRQLLTDPTVPEEFADYYADFAGRVQVREARLHGTVVLEGAQGVLLDEWYGFDPYTTWSTTTFRNAEHFLRDGNFGELVRVGVTRPYVTRHGAGPLPTESPQLTVRVAVTDDNAAGTWQGSLRAGHFDEVTFRYALSVCGPLDVLAITHLDQLPAREWQCCDRYHGCCESLTQLPGRSRRHDLAYQRRLTEVLRTAKPVYQTIPVHRVVDHLSALADTPDVLCTFGRHYGTTTEAGPWTDRRSFADPADPSTPPAGVTDFTPAATA